MLRRVANDLQVQIRLAQRDTELSLGLARTSAETAVATKRDSSSMKVIAVLTTLFLPPTFIAVSLSYVGELSPC